MAAIEEKTVPQDHLEDPHDYEEDLADIDPTLDRRLTRKFDFHIVPWLFGLWLLAFIDRSNIGNANIVGLPNDLHLKGNDFNIALTVFYVPYILFEVPSNWFLKVRLDIPVSNIKKTLTRAVRGSRLLPTRPDDQLGYCRIM